MRVYIKNKLINLMETLEQAEHIFIDLCGRRDRRQQDVLLGDMRDSMIAVGDTIERMEGFNQELLYLQEQYYNLIRRCLGTEKQPVRMAVCGQLGCVRKEISNKIIKEIPIHYEILFLPYKASMWDSLESVWKAMIQQKNCSCHVIPIPYFDRRDDGFLGEMHYEGGLYPNYVPVEDYRKFHIPQMYPDAVFIHNPYDDANAVTSVHPDYYAKNLKNHTGMLIYIPYYISGENMDSRFCVNMASLLADKVIVQDKRIQRSYIKECREWAEKQGVLETLGGGEKFEGKFLALGSPKTDRIMRYKRQDYELPAKWQELIKGKKVILYNTSIAALLSNNDQELKKIEDVLFGFRNEKAVLWWRPHPLGATTYSSMRPQFLPRYLALIDKYRQLHSGIYDDTSDLHRAIAWSDACYGDDGSLVHLCGLAGKPIMIQNCHILSNYGKKVPAIFFDDCICDGQRLWFFAGNHNGLFMLEMESGTAVYLGEAPGERGLLCRLYSRILKEGDFLWLIPARAKALVKYDIQKGIFTEYGLPEEAASQPLKFRSAFIHNGILYMVPGECSYIVAFDMTNETMSADASWLEEIRKNPSVKLCSPYAFESTVLEGDSIWFVIHNTGFAAEYAVKTGMTKLHRVGRGDKIYSYLAYYNGMMYLASQDNSGELIRWDRESNETEVICKGSPLFSENECMALAADKEGVYMAPSGGKKVLWVEPEKKEVRELIVSEGEPGDSCFIKVIGDGRILIEKDKGKGLSSLCILDKEKGECRIVKLGEERDFSKNTKDLARASEYILWESWDLGIEKMIAGTDLMDSLGERKAFARIYENSDGSCGQKIADEILKFLRE